MKNTHESHTPGGLAWLFQIGTHLPAGYPFPSRLRRSLKPNPPPLLSFRFWINNHIVARLQTREKGLLQSRHKGLLQSHHKSLLQR